MLGMVRKVVSDVPSGSRMPEQELNIFRQVLRYLAFLLAKCTRPRAPRHCVGILARDESTGTFVSLQLEMDGGGVVIFPLKIVRELPDVFQRIALHCESKTM